VIDFFSIQSNGVKSSDSLYTKSTDVVEVNGCGGQGLVKE